MLYPYHRIGEVAVVDVGSHEVGRHFTSCRYTCRLNNARVNARVDAHVDAHADAHVDMLQ